MKQHKADLTSLIFGVAFLAIAGLALAEQSLDFEIYGLEWLIPVLAALAGVGILAGGRSRSRNTDNDTEAFKGSDDSID
jgi:hypothetical protein